MAPSYLTYLRYIHVQKRGTVVQDRLCVEKLMCRNGLCSIRDVWNRFVVNWGLCGIVACCIEACAETPRVGSVAGVIHSSFV